MKTAIELVTKEAATSLISNHPEIKLTEDGKKVFKRCLRASAYIWVGSVGPDLVCIFGLVPPSLSDDRAYLWLHTTDRVKDYEFTFVRQSQIAIRKMLDVFPTIIGDCEINADRSRRWLCWLGATFSPPKNGLRPFKIVRA